MLTTDRPRQKRQFVCVLDTADGSGAGPAAVSLSRAKLWFSVELHEPQAIRKAAIVADDPRRPLEVQLFARAENVPESHLVGWIGVPELGAVADDLFRREGFRLEVISDARLMGGELHEVVGMRTPGDEADAS